MTTPPVTSAPAGPLDGVRVIDLSSVVMGPRLVHCTAQGFGSDSSVADLAADERLLSPARRARHWDELCGTIAEVAPTLTTAEWERLCAEHGVPMARVLDVTSAVDDPYVQEGHLLDVHTHPTAGEYQVNASPVRFSATPTALRRHAPTLGQDIDDVLAELR